MTGDSLPDRALVEHTRRALDRFLPARRQDAAVELARYIADVEHWGARIDLTAARSRDELVDLSVVDAAVIARVELERGAPDDVVCDVGTGGGAPGIPLLVLLALERGPISGQLVEPREKRVAFLRTVVGKLLPTGVQVHRSRSEVLPSKSVDVALARATLPPAAWLEEGARLARRAVWVLLAQEPPPELGGWREDVNVRYEWPATKVSRRAVRYVPASTQISCDS